MTNRLLVLFAILGIFVFAGACKNSQSTNSGTATNSRTGNQATPDQFASTRKLYEKNCQNCHGANGEGGPVKLDDGTKLKVPTFREGHAVRHPDSDFLKQITKGGDGMPAFADKLKPEEMNDLIKFIRHEFQGGMMPPGEPMKSPMKDVKMN
jgi:mono/diheme cytochrome c family protein